MSSFIYWSDFFVTCAHVQLYFLFRLFPHLCACPVLFTDPTFASLVRISSFIYWSDFFLTCAHVQFYKLIRLLSHSYNAGSRRASRLTTWGVKLKLWSSFLRELKLWSFISCSCWIRLVGWESSPLTQWMEIQFISDSTKSLGSHSAYFNVDLATWTWVRICGFSTNFGGTE